MSQTTSWRPGTGGVGEASRATLHTPHPQPPAPGVPFWSLQGECPTPSTGSAPGCQRGSRGLLTQVRSRPRPLGGLSGVGAALGKRVQRDRAFLLRHRLFSRGLLETWGVPAAGSARRGEAAATAEELLADLGVPGRGVGTHGFPQDQGSPAPRLPTPPHPAHRTTFTAMPSCKRFGPSLSLSRLLCKMDTTLPFPWVTAHVQMILHYFGEMLRLRPPWELETVISLFKSGVKSQKIEGLIQGLRPVETHT